MNAVDALFQRLRALGQKAFIPFIVGGDPDADTTTSLLNQLPGAGADLIEVGFPFSDPIADGPVIQAAYTRALDRGLKITQVFDAVRHSVAATPIVGMVSYSLIHRRGPGAFVEEAKANKVSGLIVPDLVADEAAEMANICRANDMKLILLVTPTTTPKRAEQIVNLCSGFVYCVSIVGITGEQARLPEALTQQLAFLRTLTNLPLCVGFGVSRPEHVAQLKPIADGIIVGSAIVKKLEAEGVPGALGLAKTLAGALKS